MQLLTKEIYETLKRNGERNGNHELYGKPPEDFFPAVKLFTPDGAATWLLTELEPGTTDIAFGLCDLGMGYPELGSVSLTELAQVRGRLGLLVERDRYFTADKSLSAYAEEAHREGRIVA